jgi:6-phosphofructokinase 1
MVAIRGNEIISISLEEVGGRLRLVDPENGLVNKARHMGVCFGDQ